ncbi:Protein of unknown function (DUF2983) [Beggiatoa alba B18LD]|uniref:Uncharacterized protein n=1 Tax=Beggiatoa alba B18LD TaxID=395493 RepID=I3CJY4_9GAMM|nr:cysteine protease StiP domain-containing protein [Beggiatoa alba]EIJ43927.1 Protein of unknown function (DUF2983) [Beggiatoa alba B18LD]
MIHYAPFSGSYLPTDVLLLFKPILIESLETSQVVNIRTGEPIVEPLPTEDYLTFFYQAVTHNKKKLAYHILSLAHLLHTTKSQFTLVSLARSGTPIGVLIKRTLEAVFSQTVPHYSISLIREKGIDENALRYILEQQGTNGEDIVFIDAWTGKGILTRELHKWVSLFNHHFNTCISTKLWVITNIAGGAVNSISLEDYLIPSALLKTTVSGLTSQAILHRRYVGVDDFHGCFFYQAYQQQDLSLWFVEQIMAEVNALAEHPVSYATVSAEAKILRQQENANFLEYLMRHLHIPHSSHIYPSIGGTIRVLLRHMPQKILVKRPQCIDVAAIEYLANIKQVPIEVHTEMPYQAVGIMN